MFNPETNNALVLCENLELSQARAEHGESFASRHEAYAVILEELQEAQQQIERLNKAVDMFWRDIKSDVADNRINYDCYDIQTAAHLAAMELCQVIACARKAKIDAE